MRQPSDGWRNLSDTGTGTYAVMRPGDLPHLGDLDRGTFETASNDGGQPSLILD